jgi:hypothetical protein
MIFKGSVRNTLDRLSYVKSGAFGALRGGSGQWPKILRRSLYFWETEKRILQSLEGAFVWPNFLHSLVQEFRLQVTITTFLQCVRKVAVHSGYSPYIWLSVPKLPLQCAVVSLYSVVIQRLECNTGTVCDCLIQFLLTVVLSIEERVFLAVYVFREGNRYTNLVQQEFAETLQETTCTLSQCYS